MTTPPKGHEHEVLLRLPLDNVLALVDPVLGRLDEAGLLPRKRASPPAAVRALNLAPGASRQVTRVGNRVLGYALRADAAGGSVELRDGLDVNGDLLAPVILAASSATGVVWFGPDGIACSGLFAVNVGAGVVDGAVFLGEV